MKLAEALDSDELIDELARVEHERWSRWEKWRTREGVTARDEARWARQSATKYDDLTPQEKDLDRKEAKKTVRAIKFYLLARVRFE